MTPLAGEVLKAARGHPSPRGRFDSDPPALLLDFCGHDAAKYAAKHWHYSETLPTPPLVKIGVWERGVFIGVVVFGRGAKGLCRPYGLTQDEVCELARVALREHETPTSRIVAIAVKLLRSQSPALRLIVSFADANRGHIGTLYQAGGWLYLGRTAASSRYRDATGRIWHGRQVSSTGLRKQYGQFRPMPKISDCERIAELPKFRYCMALDKRMRKQLTPLAQSYPKGPECLSDAPE